MVASVEIRKFELISFIANLQKEESLIAIEKTVKKLKPAKKLKPSKISAEKVEYFRRPFTKNLTLNQLASAQNWQPIDEKEMDAIIKSLDIQEPIEQLLADLKALR